MSTHIGANMGDYADTVLLPGDPLRAKYIAENFLTNVKQVNSVRNAFGYTGEYKGHRVSVQGSGMGIPSMSIYINELVKFFGVKTIIRVGSCGGMAPDVHLRDVLLASGSTTDSAVTANTFGPGIHYAPLANFELLDTAFHEAQKMGITPKVGDIFAADRFYNDELDMKKLADYGVIGTEMESAGLYLLGAKLHFRALSVLTVSDLIFGEEKTTAEEREKTFNDMINISLATAIAGK
ncbi:MULTISPECIES: purine-nucleoside phosphorylase [Furfurilactobacillus]|uniref:Purine nucleoside phosphorylase DeoD-type n=2 Tax=Furfurilactobacillus TaxID=2767882 RepID=A0A0R1RQ11_9LACO|nr:MULTISPECIES: purine-nucleoside phosphorylase [Furfurilactobacillus]KRL56194.1 purine nucleoside phosphorylase [Furfurilactobacillus rossiae DSM 15814]MCF6165890.1 purine-nucleoside phosphorylase [Furfurilactobacillus rossiae]MYV18077.1 purine-nucleoside phosphorylase [Furfurilactobacillus milii]QFR66213.1 purine-nucleoside phosphorylase [Furfurilactobacillus rossiae]QLE61652.1 Purine nucleoside phosphorylase [Furfurilactobacillus rossiae]